MAKTQGKALARCEPDVVGHFNELNKTIATHAYSQRGELAFALLSLVLSVAVVWGTRKAIVYYEDAEQEKQERRVAESKDHFWMMNIPAPKGSGRFWLPAYGNHTEGCDTHKFSRAEAYMEAVLLVQEGHFHVIKDNEYGGFRLDEFLDDRNGKGEFCAERVPSTITESGWMRKRHAIFSQGSHPNSTRLQPRSLIELGFTRSTEAD